MNDDMNDDTIIDDQNKNKKLNNDQGYDLSLNVNHNLINTVDEKIDDESKKLNLNKDIQDLNSYNEITEINDRLKVLNKTEDDLQKLVYDSSDN